MSYEVYKDSRYIAFLNQFKEDREKLKSAAKRSVIEYADIMAATNKLMSNLQNNVMEFNRKKLAELNQNQEEIAKEYQPEIDYTGNEAKHLEVKFALAEDHDLKNYVQVMGDNMLENNLLRLELRKRGMTDEDSTARRHVVGLQSQYVNDDRYNAIQKQAATINTLGNKGIYDGGDLLLFDNLAKDVSDELRSISEEHKSSASSAQAFQQAMANM